MPFQRILDDLQQRTRADFAVFCDYEGEAISLSSPAMATYDVRIAGAQLGGTLFHLQQLARESGQSERLSVHLLTERQTVLVEVLPGGYYVVLGLPPAALWPVARALLRQVADRFLSEL